MFSLHKKGNMSYSLLTYIYNSVWFLEEASQDGLFLLVENIYNGNIASIDYSVERAKNRAYVITADSNVNLINEDETLREASQEHSIAVIPIMGAITLQDQRCGPSGTATIGKNLMIAAANPNIDSVILSIDSPGGEAHAMFDLTNSINEYKQKCKKPIVAYVGSMAASAAYGVAATCNKIVCSDPNTIVGSIGSYVTLLDKKKSLANEGKVIEEIYADDSSEKNLDVREALAGNDKPIKATLKKYNDRFKNIVTTGRPDIQNSKTTDPLKGATIFAEDALSMNLIDEIGNMSVAKKHCATLNTYNYSQNNEEMKINFKTTWLAIASIFPSMKDGEEMTVEQIEKLNADLTEAQTSLETATDLVTEKDTEISNLNLRVSDLVNGGTTLQAALTATEVQRDAYLAELKLRPGTIPIVPVVTVEPIEVVTTTIVVDEINEEAKKYRTT